MTLYGPLASKSTLVDTEHLPKVRKTVTPITSLIFQGQTRTVGSELTLVSAPGLVSREQKQLLLLETTASAGVHCSVLSPGSVSQWSSSSLSRSFCPVLVTSCKEGETFPTHRVLTDIFVKFKVWLWQRNTRHNGVSIQNLCPIISSSKKFSDAPWSLWKMLFNSRMLYWALYCKEMKIPIHVLVNICEISK